MVVKKRIASATIAAETTSKGKATTKPHAGLHANGGVQPKKKAKKGKVTPDVEIRASKDGQSNVLYIGHIPHGFFEKQIREFFSQFGTVTNVRLSRSKKTAKSKGYAFLQFQSVEVAGIAAESMDGYHMFGQKLVVKTLKKADVHPEIFNGANRVFKRIPWREIEAKRHNKEREEHEEKNRASRARRAAKKRMDRIAAAGIEYVFDPNDDEGEKKGSKAKATPKASKSTAVEAKGATKAVKMTKAVKATKTPPAKVASKAAKVTKPAKTPTTTRAQKSKPTSEKKPTPAMTRSRAAARK